MPALSQLAKVTKWIAALEGEHKGLFQQYLKIRKDEGASFLDILNELVAHLPDIIAFITAIVSLFKATHPEAAA